jgi:hypothetical protein
MMSPQRWRTLSANSLTARCCIFGDNNFRYFTDWETIEKMKEKANMTTAAN